MAYRHVFIGREAELEQLQLAYAAAAAGVGSLALVVGEPGIGKTALCEQLIAHVVTQQGQALLGNCYEAGSPSLPYLPFLQALRRYLADLAPVALQQALGTGAPDVVRILPELGERLQLAPRPAGDPRDDRWRFLQAVSDVPINAANRQPVLLVLEDLHDADQGTLDLLLRVARSVAGSRLFVTGTYRDVEVDRIHPLSGALAELRRVGPLRRIALRGLSVDEVQRMSSELHGTQVSRVRAEDVQRQTDGNPLFVQEVVRYLIETDVLAGARATGNSFDSAIPEGLRDVIGKRLN